MSINIDVSELNQLAIDLGDAPREVLAKTRVAVQKTSADIKRDGQAFAPVDTGNLRSSISYETRELANSVVGEIGPTAAYGVYVEFGTSRMAPHAFMGPAFDRHAPQFVSAVGKIAGSVL